MTPSVKALWLPGAGVGGCSEGFTGKRGICSSRVFHCLLNCLRCGWLLPERGSVQHFVAHAGLSLVGICLFLKGLQVHLKDETLLLQQCPGLNGASRCRHCFQYGRTWGAQLQKGAAVWPSTLSRLTTRFQFQIGCLDLWDSNNDWQPLSENVLQQLLYHCGLALLIALG